MRRSGKAKGKDGKRAPSATGVSGVPHARGGPRRGGAGEGDGKGSWLGSKRPVVRFVLVFGVLIIGFNIYFSASFSQGRLFESYLGLNARLSAAVLQVLGEDATARGTSLSSPRFSLSIKAGCDAIQASAFFVFAVLASPVAVSWLRRLRVVLLGTLLLLAVNLIRIVSLYYTGVFYPNAFETMHVEVWQAGFIFLPIFLWLAWVHWTMRRGASKPDVPE